MLLALIDGNLIIVKWKKKREKYRFKTNYSLKLRWFGKIRIVHNETEREKKKNDNS